MKSKRSIALFLALIMMMSTLASCAKTETETKSDSETKADSVTADSDGLYFTQQEVRKSPE